MQTRWGGRACPEAVGNLQVFRGRSLPERALSGQVLPGQALPDKPGTERRAGLHSVFELADMILCIKLFAELLDQLQLRFQEVDMAFLVCHELNEQIA